MQTNSKVCVTTYIWGDRYQEYVPIAAYSILKMYPEYDLILFLHGSLNPSLKECLKKLGLEDRVKIIEHKFSDCPNMNPNKAMAFRWVLWDDLFLNYDYLYTIDIDMFYIKEPLPLHVQHIYHMKEVTHLPFDNMRRVLKRSTFSLKQQIIDILYYVKNFGVKYLFSYIKKARTDIYMLSGLHFVDIKQYYSILSKERLESYRLAIYDDSYMKDLNTFNNEAFLYKMLKESGFDVNSVATQDWDNLYAHCDFNNYNKALFRPTHGVHMGNYRGTPNPEHIHKILSIPSEVYYKDFFINNLIPDPDFMTFLDCLNDTAKDYFRKYFAFINVDVKF